MPPTEARYLLPFFQKLPARLIEARASSHGDANSGAWTHGPPDARGSRRGHLLGSLSVRRW